MRKPTLRMRKTMSVLVGNGGKSVSDAMRQAGYAEATINTPQKVTESLSWKQLMDKYFPEDYVAKKHKELFNANKLHLTKDAREIVPDNAARAQAQDMAYKLRGSYKATEVKLTGLEQYKDLPIEQLQKIANGTP